MRVHVSNPQVRQWVSPYVRIWSSDEGNITTLHSYDQRGNDLELSWSDPDLLDKFIAALERIREDIADNRRYKSA